MVARAAVISPVSALTSTRLKLYLSIVVVDGGVIYTLC